MNNLSGESREQNRKEKVTRFPSVTCARSLELLVNTLGSHLATRGILSTPASNVHELLNKGAQRLKLQKSLLKINKRNIIW